MTVRSYTSEALNKASGPRINWRDGLLSATTLQNTSFPAVRYVLPGYIPEGVTILAGKPKAGKSWLALDLAIAVAAGRFTLGTLQPPQGDVLYLALEDNQRRLKRRMAKLLGDSLQWPGRLSLKTEWRRTNEGGLDDIREWIAESDNPRLVIIDILAAIRPMVGSQAQAYTTDYQAIEGLQKLAGECGLAILVLVHVRKMEADDPFDTISGTLGLTGGADTILVMKRQSGSMTLFAKGRDIEESETAIQFSKEACRWTILGDASDVHRSAERTAILGALEVAGEDGMNLSEIMAATGRNKRNAIDQLLFKMKGAGEVVRVKRGVYALDKSFSSKGGKIGQKERSGTQAFDIEAETNNLPNLSNLTGRSSDNKPDAVADFDLEIPTFLRRLPPNNSPALGPEGDSLDDFR